MKRTLLLTAVLLSTLAVVAAAWPSRAAPDLTPYLEAHQQFRGL